MVIFTSVCANYVHKARTLAQSVKKNIPDAKMVLCLVEKEVDSRIPDECFDEIILAKDAWEGNFNRFIFKHAIVEASTAVKGQFFRYLMDRYTEESQFVYLDPDVYVYSDFVELRNELKHSPIVLCPHLLKPGNIDMELSSTAHGVYNLGFLGISRSEEGRKCVDWWADRLYLFCYDDIQRGIFTDQKWFDLVPCFFNATVFKHHGYDFAPWSLLNCNMETRGSEYYIEGDPLRFIHFSGLGHSAEKCMKDWLPEGEHPFKELYARYKSIHDANNTDNISKTPWSYSRYESGEPIDDEIRIAYRSNYDVMFMEENPFVKSNRFYEKALKDNISLKNTYKIRKAMKILREEGIVALLKKVWGKVNAR